MVDTRRIIQTAVKNCAVSEEIKELKGPARGLKLLVHVKKGKVTGLVVVDKGGKFRPVVLNPQTAAKKCYHVSFRGGEPNYQPLPCDHPEVNFAVYDD